MYRTFGKRLFDLVIALPAFIVLLPIQILVALTVIIRLGPPTFFRQTRPGKKGQPFTIYKFRTMTQPAGGEDPLLSDMERLTALGRFLRASSLDELPELTNIIKGDMSLVGPRPLLMQYLPRYNAEQMRRHEVKPGLTGWAQINGRNAVSWEEKFAFDVWYVENMSFTLDLKILLLTVKKIFTREGITAAGHATMAEFMGEPQ